MYLENNMSEDSSFKDIHNYNTWSKNNILRHQSRRSWGQNHFIYQAANDWNINFYLLNEVKNVYDILSFKY